MNDALQLRLALSGCLGVMLRMIPDLCVTQRWEQCTNEQHDAAITAAAEALYGSDRAAWPKPVLDLLNGRYM